jgi:hypothetical protein
VIEAFEEEKQRAAQPGYVSRYEDFDADEDEAPPRPSPKVEPAQIQGAEPPRGPHKPPAEQPETAKPKQDDFGAGIFD